MSMTDTPQDGLPHSAKEWLKEAKVQKVNNVFPDGLSVYNSASDLLWKQYLLLRVYWQVYKVRDLVTEYFLGERYDKEASDMFKDQAEWEKYLKSLSDFGDGIAGLPKQSIGMFNATLRSQVLCLPDIRPEAVSGDDRSSNMTPQPGLVKRIMVDKKRLARTPTLLRREHERVQEGYSPANVNIRPRTVTTHSGMVTSSKISEIGSSTESKSSSGGEDTDPSFTPDNERRQRLRASDESDVNQALCMFTLTLLELLPENRLYSSTERRAFKFDELWTARTDGLIFSSNNKNEVHAIFECKRSRRVDILKSVRQQEAGEMASWIYDRHSSTDIGIMCTDHIKEGPQKGRYRHKRLLIAQDCDRLFIIIGEYTSDYVDYIKGTSDPDGGTFLRMLEFGPFRIERREEMQILAMFLYAFFKRQEAKMADRERKRNETPTSEKGDPTHRGRSQTVRDGSRTGSREPPKGADHSRSGSRSRSRPETPVFMRRDNYVEQDPMRPRRSALARFTTPPGQPRSQSRPREQHDQLQEGSSAQRSHSKDAASSRASHRDRSNDKIPPKEDSPEFQFIEHSPPPSRPSHHIFGSPQENQVVIRQRQQEGPHGSSKPVQAVPASAVAAATAAWHTPNLPSRTKPQPTPARRVPPTQPNPSRPKEDPKRYPLRKRRDDKKPKDDEK